MKTYTQLTREQRYQIYALLEGEHTQTDIAADKDHTVGRNGLNADQVLRCAVIKMLMNFTYERLEFHLSDSQAMRAFAKLNYNQKTVRVMGRVF